MVDPQNPQAPAAESAEAVASTPSDGIDLAAAARASALDRLGDTPAGQALAAAFGDTPLAEPEAPRDPPVEPASDDVLETSQEREQDGDQPDAADDAEADDEPELPPEPRNRRERFEARQAAEATRQAEIAAAVEQALAADRARQVAEQKLQAKLAEQAEVLAQVQQFWGTDVDEQALIDQVADGNFEAADTLKAVRAKRKELGLVYQAIQTAQYGELYQKFQTAKSLPGVDPAVVDSFTEVPALLKHVSESAAQAERAEWQGKLERQKADYESRLARAAGRLPSTERGGAPAGGPAISGAEVAARMQRGDVAWLAANKAEINRLATSGQLN